MENCAKCTYLDVNNPNDFGKFLCEKKYERHFATDPACNSFCTAYSRDYYTIKNAIECSEKHSSSNCFLTTMICNILGMQDNNWYLQIIRNFRNNILQKNDKYKSLLVEYDIIGPKISNALQNDPLRNRIAKIYFEKYILNICLLINNKNYDEAIYEYKNMTNELKTFYGLSNIDISINELNNADIQKSGHGQYVKKLI